MRPIVKDPAALPGIQRVLAIPMKRFDKPLLGFLSKGEIQAILDAPPSDRWSGQRDRIYRPSSEESIQIEHHGQVLVPFTCRAQLEPPRPVAAAARRMRAVA